MGATAGHDSSADRRSVSVHFRASLPLKSSRAVAAMKLKPNQDLLMTIFAWLKIIPIRAAILLIVPLCANIVLAQTAPASSNHPWIGPREQQVKRDAGLVRDSVSTIDAAKTYSLAELIDFAQANNPETRV